MKVITDREQTANSILASLQKSNATVIRASTLDAKHKADAIIDNELAKMLTGFNTNHTLPWDS